MDRIIGALETTLAQIDNIDRGVQGSVIDNPATLATKL
jgi:hypothetical protein